MSKIEEVRAQMVQAMKSGDKERKDVLSLLLSALKAKWVDKHEDLTVEEENEVIQREVRQTKEAIETTPAERKDLIEKNQFALSVLEEFAPKGLSEEEISAMLREVLTQQGLTAPTPKDKGRVMKALMPLVKGRADGAVVNRLVTEACSAK
jgi:uncharacterized protein YqeY